MKTIEARALAAKLTKLRLQGSVVVSLADHFRLAMWVHDTLHQTMTPPVTVQPDGVWVVMYRGKGPDELRALAAACLLVADEAEAK